tara:strand:+ start:94 stop:678 length:585 start_codon:yes stop_codon:yes gene_type:complete
MMKIYNVKREQGRSSNRYCGPAAISALTNKDTAETAKALRKRGFLKQVTGVSWRLLKNTLYFDYGIIIDSMLDFSKDPANKRPTLSQWLKNTVKTRSPGRVFLIIAGHHYQIITGRRYICGRLNNGSVEICSIKDKRVKRGARVEQVFEVFPNEKKHDEWKKIHKRGHMDSQAAFLAQVKLNKVERDWSWTKKN